MQNEQLINVLYVDDQVNNLLAFTASYRREYNIFTAISAMEAKAILAANEIHVLITDQKMPETQGTQLLQEAVRDYPLQTRIMLTAYSDNEAIFDAFHKGLIYKYMLKPWDFTELKNTIDMAYEVYLLNKLKQSLYDEWVKTNQDLDALIAKTTSGVK